MAEKKKVRIEFTMDEYNWLAWDAGQLGVSMAQLAHDRAMGVFGDDLRLAAVQILSEEMVQVREALNRQIRRETESEIRLYEDNMIRMELEVGRLEGIVEKYISAVLREVV